MDFATRKMVNVASQLPFNIHNRVHPTGSPIHPLVQQWILSIRTMITHSTRIRYSNGDIARLRKERSKYYHGLGRLRSISPSFHGSQVGPWSRTRSPSPNAEPPSAARLLNIRLVGYTDPRTRGRARERTQHPTGLPGLGARELPNNSSS
jgi:hypothetical protein